METKAKVGGCFYEIDGKLISEKEYLEMQKELKKTKTGGDVNVNKEKSGSGKD